MGIHRFYFRTQKYFLFRLIPNKNQANPNFETNKIAGVTRPSKTWDPKAEGR
jgi:hypothetical protein